MRAVALRPFKVRLFLEDEGGVLVEADALPTCTVRNGAGTSIATGTTALESTGVYTFTVPAQTQLDVLEATFSFTLSGSAGTYVEPITLVDRRVVPLSVLRQQESLSGLSVADFLRVVDQAEDAAVRLLNYPPVLQGTRIEFRHDDAARLYVPGIYYPQAPYAVSHNDDAYDAQRLADIVARGHALERASYDAYGSYDPVIGAYAGAIWPYGVYTMHLAYGLKQTPGDLAKAVRDLARHIGRTSTYPDRATRVMTEASDIWLASPDGDKRLTGLPEVDGVLIRYRISTPFADDLGTF